MSNMCVVNTSVPVSISASVNYCPQQSCRKVIFSQASVSHSVHRGCLPQYMLGYTPRPGTPPPPWAGKPPPGRYTPHDGHCSGWYASYWNAFLFFTPSTYYCPQHSFGKVMFLRTSVSHFVHGGRGKTPPSRHHPLRQTPPDTHPSCPVHAGIHAPRRPLQRTVRILLECFLVQRNNH